MVDVFQKEQFTKLGSYCQQFMYIKLHSVEHSVLFHEYIHHI